MPQEFRDPAESPRASQPADFAEIEAREILSAAVRCFPGNLPLTRVAFENLVLNVCASTVAAAIDEAGAGQGKSAHEILARVYTEIRAMPNPWLALRCFPIVFSLPCGDGESETDLAREFGITKGGVSEVCIRLRERFGVGPGRGMKDDDARESYGRRQLGKRARPPASPWPFRGLFTELRTT